MSRHRIAVIGLGMAVTPHAKSLLDLQDRVEVAFAFSRSEARRLAFAERFDLPTTGDLDRILADASVDAVMVLTPPNTHLDLVERCAAARKHILLEKPLERSTERALLWSRRPRRRGSSSGSSSSTGSGRRPSACATCLAKARSARSPRST